MLKTLIIGGAGYTGQELCKLVTSHPQLKLGHVFASAGSKNAGEPLPLGIKGVIEDGNLEAILAAAKDAQVILLATPHEASAELVPDLVRHSDALIVDLSGGFRLDASAYPKWYGFEHPSKDLLAGAVYGLVGWNDDAIKKSRLIAAPGCYPTASLLALKPLMKAGLIDGLPIINAVSGVSGAGKSNKPHTQFCEVSLSAYGVLGHRHQPEIAQHLGCDLIFTPHLGAFDRGILATITVPVKAGTTQGQLDALYNDCYGEHPSVQLTGNLREKSPAIKNVAYTPYAQIGWAVDETRNLVVLSSAIDNLLKGAASQAVECINTHFGFKLRPLPGYGWEAL
ncbi:MAG: N-acetyl-gamma-glutamyl-phosphate reductase [Pseudomonadota bacterium]|uniref:N-acetyl-gamma-glutamyl-phosphate reductase n=1 Tax=Gallaecimonas pentaromativorans TaxID=584787 RepID=A0A3N1NTY0_9GAMM|nr:N-acetyl-gamma-glutamyl-phosphate reductase [Gallaecimonas pentaromativorans]MED5526820.1 N-acetyl-gamma-glutamyl-phosphate reductase [Pseudomonadota bacterium]ROQ23284.1 N-acetyl-gamma-glutamyl-phosphate reductase [Gallaecimonas pentaromativorans]